MWKYLGHISHVLKKLKDLKFEFDPVLNSKSLKELSFLNSNKEGLKHILIDYLKIRLSYMFLFEF